jgi:hypothetical protein
METNRCEATNSGGEDATAAAARAGQSCFHVKWIATLGCRYAMLI